MVRIWRACGGDMASIWWGYGDKVARNWRAEYGEHMIRIEQADGEDIANIWGGYCDDI